MRNAKLVIFGPKLVQMSELWLWKNGVSVILSDAPQECCSNRMPNHGPDQVRVELEAHVQL